MSPFQDEAFWKALGIIILLLSPAILGQILYYIIEYYYVHHRYNVESTEYSAKDLVHKYLYEHHMHCTIRLTKGSLTDCYVPEKDYIYLSEAVYPSRSLLSISIAFHELGHAVAFKNRERMHMLSMWVPGFIKVSTAMAIAGTFCLATGILNDRPWVWFGTLFFWGLYFFGAFTIIKREWIASQFALKMLQELQIKDEDYQKCRVLLRACWLTYVLQMIARLTIMVIVLLGSNNKKNNKEKDRQSNRSR